MAIDKWILGHHICLMLLCGDVPACTIEPEKLRPAKGLRKHGLNPLLVSFLRLKHYEMYISQDAEQNPLHI